MPRSTPNYKSGQVAICDFLDRGNLSRKYKRLNKDLVLPKLYLKNETADVFFLIEIDDKTVRLPAHKCILAESSTFFYQMFYGSSDNLLTVQEGIKINDDDRFVISLDGLKMFLEMFYSNIVKITTENVIEIYGLSDKYNVNEWKRICIDFLLNVSTIKTFWLACKLIELYQNELQELKINCGKVLKVEYVAIFSSEEFFEIGRPTLIFILEIAKWCCDKSSILDAYMLWAKKSCERKTIDGTVKNCQDELGSEIMNYLTGLEVEKSENNSNNAADAQGEPGPSSETKSIDVSDGNEVAKSFEEMKLNKLLLNGIYTYGFKSPLPIQQRTILLCINKQNVIVQASPGSGKTSAFSISILQRINTNLNECQALIVVATRESATKVHELIINLGHFLMVKIALCIGGTSLNVDKRKLTERMSHVVVGTPGRVLDLIKRNALRTNFIEVLVLDEADKMASPDFKVQFLKLHEMLPTDVQVLFFSNKLTNHLFELGNTTMFNRYLIVDNEIEKEKEIKMLSTNFDAIKHFYVTVKREEYKSQTVLEICKKLPSPSILCCNQSQMEYLTNELSKYLMVSSLGRQSKSKRKFIINQFRQGLCNVLVTNYLGNIYDDYSSTAIVINYAPPSSPKKYISTMNCVAQYKCNATVISLIGEHEKVLLKAIENLHHFTINELPSDVVSAFLPND